VYKLTGNVKHTINYRYTVNLGLQVTTSHNIHHNSNQVSYNDTLSPAATVHWCRSWYISVCGRQ